VLELLFLLRHVKDVDEDLHVLEDRLLLVHKVVLHQLVLPAAVSQVQRQLAHEPDLVFVDVDGEPDTHRLLRRVVREDDRVHRGLPRAAAAHQ